jgi:hypothetical protein
VCAIPRQWLYLFDDGGVVFSEISNRFAGLDAAGVAAYLALDGGADIGSGPAGSDLEAIFALTQGIFPVCESSFETWPDPILSPGHLTPQSSVCLDLLGIPVTIDIPEGPGGELCRDCFRSCEASAMPARWRISAQQKGYGWSICMNGREFYSLTDEGQLGLGMLHAARSLVYAEGRYDVAFHAGVVARDDYGLMLCAPREAGKSTLAAYLVARGYDFVADEPALFDLSSGTMAPLRLPISLKEGSWTALQDEWPRLVSAPVHLRSDGTRIHLAHPDDPPSRPRRVTQLVFPRYRPQAAPELELLSPFQMLQSLHEGGMLLAKSFSREQFESLLEWLVRIPGCRMHYSSLEEAQRLLENSGGVFRISK